jgi:light-regulated signal transduction histidine kinase (bacteriophytochrome)
MQTLTQPQTRRRTLEPQHTSVEVEQLAHAISHDFAQPLITIAGFARLLMSRYEFEMDAPGQEYLDFVIKGATDMQRQIDDLVTSLSST